MNQHQDGRSHARSAQGHFAMQRPIQPGRGSINDQQFPFLADGQILGIDTVGRNSDAMCRILEVIAHQSGGVFVFSTSNILTSATTSNC